MTATLVEKILSEHIVDGEMVPGTEIGIRIDTFGDRQKSEAIHDKILSKI